MTKFEYAFLYMIDGICREMGIEDTELLSKALNYADAAVLHERNENASKEAEREKNKALDESVERIYQSYPSKCANRGTSTGKCAKDKRKIKTLLVTKAFTEESLTRAIGRYVEDVQSHGSYLKNFSTFLNNIPLDEETPIDNDKTIWQ